MQVDLLTLGTILTGFVILFFLINRRQSDMSKQTVDQSMLEWLKSMQGSIEKTNKTLNDALSSNNTEVIRTLQENSRQLHSRLDKAAEVIGNVGKEVGQMSEIGRSMKELQDFLKSPKLRGNIGEEVLKDLIGQMFPKNSFLLQHQFKSGDRVDAAIKTDAGILPIDSKFPMENFQKMVKASDEAEGIISKKEFGRDVKKHIDAISKKYILPDEGTMDFALMYVPSESVFYELCNMQDIMDYARRSRVYVVSPSTLYAHLQTILLSFEGKKIESRTKEVFKLLRSLEVDYNKVEESMGVLGRHITNATSQYANVTTGFSQMGVKLQKTKQLDEELVLEIEEKIEKS